MPRILAVQSSPRKQGYTAGLMEKAVQTIKAAGVEVDEVYLADYKLEPCKSCFFCVRDEQHRCPMKDDMGSNGSDIQASDTERAEPFFVYIHKYF